MTFGALEDEVAGAPRGAIARLLLSGGVVFVATGAIPLAIAIAARHELRSEGAAAVAQRYRMNLPRQPPSSRPGENDLDRLERLADLHRAGDLTDDEYAAAKRRLLGLDS